MSEITLRLALLGGFTAGLAVILFVLLLKPVAARIGLIDRPQGRKKHIGDIPLVGGLAIFLGYVIALAILGQQDIWRVAEFWTWLGLLVLSLWDDIRQIKVWVRVLVQVSLILLLCASSGMHLEHLGHLTGDVPVMLGHLALPVTILGLIGIKNGINLLDGLDGLAGTQVLVVLFWFIVLSVQNGISILVLLCAPLAGAVAGFLVFNLRLPGRPAKIFLGDHGSVFLGFTLGWYAVLGSQSSIPAFTPIEAVWVLGIPVLDTIRVMLSRMLRGLSPFAPGRDHLHHLLVDRGFSVNGTVAVMMMLALLLGAVPWLSRMDGLSEQLLFYAFLAVSIVFFLIGQYLGSRVLIKQHQGKD